MKVKICGTRTYEDAKAALDAGAWALGFIFHRPSPRWVEPEAAARIVRRLPAGTLAVGVFVDWPLEDVNRVAADVGLRGVQLHGAEEASYAQGVRCELVIKALRVDATFDPERARGFPGCRILLDTHRAGVAGGTGEPFDWSLARRAGEWTPIILAGGIHPENVEAALRAARPDAIDVASGVESMPGVKDARKMARLFQAIERYEAEVSNRRTERW